MSEERESAELEPLRRLLRLMRCPGCRVPYRFESVPQKAANGVYGSLRCRCREWPVIDAIPILSERRVGAHEHTIGIEEHRGASAAELAEMVRAGMGGKALVECLAIPVVLPQRLRRLHLLRRLWNHPAALAVGRALGRARVRRMLRRAPESVTAQDWLQLFFGRFSPLSGSLLSYFLHRFSMKSGFR